MLKFKIGDFVEHEIYGQSKITFATDKNVSKPYVIRHKGGIHKCSENELKILINNL